MLTTRRVAAGQNTTLFLAKPSEKYSDLPRHPFDMMAPEYCVICSKDTGDEDPPLECDKVRLRSSPPVSSYTHHDVP